MNDKFCSSCGRLEKECICNSKEFCLNDEVRDCPCNKCNSKVIYLEDVREFIRLLHNEFHIAKDIETTTIQQIRTLDWVDKIIDKLAGSALI